MSSRWTYFNHGQRLIGRYEIYVWHALHHITQLMLAAEAEGHMEISQVPHENHDLHCRSSSVGPPMLKPNNIPDLPLQAAYLSPHDDTMIDMDCTWLTTTLKFTWWETILGEIRLPSQVHSCIFRKNISLWCACNANKRYMVDLIILR